MIEAYAFLAAFPVQILAMSVLLPTRFIRYIREQSTRHPTERLAQLYPGVDISLARERFLTRYRGVNTGIAVLGLLLLGWLFNYTRQADWEDGPVESLVAAYFAVQALPICFVAWLAVRFKKKVLEHSSPEGKRRAVLRRRGLFDFVSPLIVLLAVLSYLLFAAFVIYLGQHPFPGFAGPVVNLGIVTLVFALEAFCVYKMLYGRKINPVETDADSVRMMGMGVKACVYACIATTVFLSLNFTLAMLGLQRWEPFALSISLVICALLPLQRLRSFESNDI